VRGAKKKERKREIERERVRNQKLDRESEKDQKFMFGTNLISYQSPKAGCET
jgi:hypothetical protein